MKYSAYLYGKALAEALAGASSEEGRERIARNFLALVRKNGDEVHAAKIFGEAERILREERGARKVTLEFARKPDAAAQALVKSITKQGDVVEEKIDPRLIAGVRITVNDDLQFDGSLRGKLDKLFSIT